MDINKDALDTVCNLAVSNIKDEVWRIKKVLKKATGNTDEWKQVARYWLNMINDIESICDLDGQDLQKNIDKAKTYLRGI